MVKGYVRRALVAALSMTTASAAMAMLPFAALAAKEGETVSDNELQSPDAYTLVWEDDFDGDGLDLGDWNVETHEAGWVNAELQRYTSLDEGNIEVHDGMLRIRPHIAGGNLAEDADGGEVSLDGEITSGRISTQGKHDFKYGRFETRARVPKGQGYLPAFWLMATNESFYGQWPKCGEVDIMEVMGQDTSRSYHTVHYGYDQGSGHKQNQGTYTLDSASLDYSDDFHIFTLDWDPGKMTWYVDGQEVYTTNDWYTGSSDDDQLTYPAPFDQDFYLILNLAVGGSWVGYPTDEVKEAMNDAAFDIDYVRVYQKSQEEYERLENEAVSPQKDPDRFRKADESGNYVINSNFTNDIGIDGSASADKDNWKFHVESDAYGASYVTGSEGITITPSSAGSQLYSIQLKQEHIPMYKGWEYELSFDAYSTMERDIVVDVDGPDRQWIRYLQDETVRIGTDKKTYTIDFVMNDKTDANGCVEFNLGKQPSTAPVTISNVRIIHKSGEEAIEQLVKEVRADGNYIYNGSFDQGDKRLGYWEYSDADKEQISVTNSDNKRELKVVVPDGAGEVKLSQSALSPLVKGTYELSFTARTEGEASSDGILLRVSGKEYRPEVTGESKKYSSKLTFNNDNSREESYLEIIFNKPGTYYLDDIRLSDGALIRNGSFDLGMTGYYAYVQAPINASYVIADTDETDNTFIISIEDTMDDGSNPWYIQLIQDGVRLENGRKYRLSFKAKSSIERAVSYCVQEYEGSWQNYSNTGSVEIGSDWQTISSEFTMDYPSDDYCRFGITMGSVDGKRITDKHDIYIDDITLIDITDEDESGTGDNGGDDQGEVTEPVDDDNTDDPTPGEGGSESGGETENGSETDPGTGSGSGEDSGNPSEIEDDHNEDTPSDENTGDDTEEDKPQEPAKPVVPPMPVIVRRVIKTVVKLVSKILRSLFRW